MGTAPNRQLVVTWDQIERYPDKTLPSPQNRVSFQAVIYENSNDVDVRFKSLTMANPEWSQGVSATVGVVGRLNIPSSHEAAVFSSMSPIPNLSAVKFKYIVRSENKVWHSVVDVLIDLLMNIKTPVVC